jgi:disulfide bond formation protein DsbB
MKLDHSGSVDAWNLLLAAWVVALLATVAALFIGEVMGRTPCNLCWFQRIFMFPLAVVLGIACYRSDFGAWRYALPLAALGWLIALYHSLLYWGIMPASLEPCREGVSCSGAAMRIWSLPLPALSLASFTLVILLLELSRQRSSQ